MWELCNTPLYKTVMQRSRAMAASHTSPGQRSQDTCAYSTVTNGLNFKMQNFRWLSFHHSKLVVKYAKISHFTVLCSTNVPITLKKCTYYAQDMCLLCSRNAPITGAQEDNFPQRAEFNNLILKTFITLKLDFNHSGCEQACTNDAPKMHTGKLNWKIVEQLHMIFITFLDHSENFTQSICGLANITFQQSCGTSRSSAKLERLVPSLYTTCSSSHTIYNEYYEHMQPYNVQ